MTPRVRGALVLLCWFAYAAAVVAACWWFWCWWFEAHGPGSGAR